MAEGITAISVHGYRSLAVECAIEVHPLTILTGPNGSGKSSIMEPLLMMKQTLEASYDPGPLLICGPNIRFSRPDQIRSRMQLSDSFKVRLEWGFGASSLEETFTFGPDGPEITQAAYTDMGEVTTLRRDMNHEHMASFMPRWQEENREILEARLGRPVQWSVARERCFLLPKAVSGSQGEFQHFSFSLPSEPFDLALRKLIHVPALRGQGERPRRAVPSDHFFPGSFEDYAGSIVTIWRASEDSRIEDLERWIEALGIPCSLDGIDDAGSGASQVLPVLVALLAAGPGQLVYIEHPESHLCVEAQAALARVLAEAAGRGVRAIIETHSSYIVGEVRDMVKEGNVRPGMAQIYRFQRRDDGSAAAVSTLP